MLDLIITDVGKEKQTRATQVRHGDDLAALIEHAAWVLGVAKSVFLRAAIEKEANRVLEANSRRALTKEDAKRLLEVKPRHVLAKEDAKRFAKALDTPPPPTPLALKAAESHRRSVLHAD